jgi:hypothetical protein
MLGNLPGNHSHAPHFDELRFASICYEVSQAISMRFLILISLITAKIPLRCHNKSSQELVDCGWLS